MNHKRTLCWLVGGILLGSGIGESRAGPITWEFTGEVISVSGQFRELGDPIVEGSPYVGSFTFESETPDSAPGSSVTAIYEDAITSLSGMVGSHSYSGPTDARQFIAIDLPTAIDFDSFTVVAEIEFLGQLAEFRWQFIDQFHTVFSSTELPIVPLELTPVSSLFVAIFYEPEAVQGAIVVDVTSLTPEPGSLALVLMGVALVCRRRTRTSRAVLPTS